MKPKTRGRAASYQAVNAVSSAHSAVNDTGRVATVAPRTSDMPPPRPPRTVRPMGSGSRRNLDVEPAEILREEVPRGPRPTAVSQEPKQRRTERCDGYSRS